MLVQGMQVRIEELTVMENVGRALAWLHGTGALVSTITQLLIAPISDNFPTRLGRRRPFVLIGTLLAFPFVLWFVRTDTFWQLVISFVLIQFTLNFAAAPFQALIPDLVPLHKHGIASAYMAAWSLLGNALGIGLSGWMLASVASADASVVNARGLATMLFIVHGALMVAALVTLLKVREAHSASRRSISQAMRTAIADLLSKDVWEHRDFLWLFISRFFIQMGVYSAIPFFRWYVRDTLGVTDVAMQTAQIGLCAILGGAIAAFPAGRLADKFSKRLIIYIACSIAAIGGSIFCITSSVHVVRIAALILGIGYGAFAAVDWAFVCNLVPRERAAKFMAVFHIAFTLPQVLGAGIGGWVGDWGNATWGIGVGWRLVFCMCVIYFIIGAVLIRNVRELKVSSQ